MVLSGLKGSDLGSLALSRTEQKSLYAAGVFFILAIVFSAFSIASTILSTVSLTGSVEKSIVAGMGIAIVGVVVPLGCCIDRKATSTREKGSRFVATARLLLLGAMFCGVVCLAAIVAIAIGPLEPIYLSASAGATVCVAGLFGCLFGASCRARVATQAAMGDLVARTQRTARQEAKLGIPASRLVASLPRDRQSGH